MPRPIGNLLRDLPSIAGIPCVREHLRRPDVGDRASVTRLLELDPLTVLRCLRTLRAPVNGSRGRVRSLEAMVEELGISAVLRALDTPVREVREFDAVRDLWLHAVATAIATRHLGGDLPAPERSEAFLLGLIHDLPLWIHFQRYPGAGRVDQGLATAWIGHWNLPERFRGAMRHAFLGGVSRELPRDPMIAVLYAAERCAELAGFGHPGCDDELSRMLVAERAEPREHEVAATLRGEVAATLAAQGLDLDAVERGSGGTGQANGQTRLFTGKHRGSMAELVLTLHRCSEASDYKSILTVAVAAGLRYLDFDRVYLLRHDRLTGEVWVRSKADLTPIPIAPMRMRLNEGERAHFDRALANGNAQVISADPQAGPGILSLLGTDEAILVALNTNFATPSFLVLDRSLSMRPLEAEHDLQGALVLAGTASMLVQNLLLRRRAVRSAKHAHMDVLTGLHNRGVGLAALEAEISRSVRESSPMAVMMLDLDDFKKLNDTFGHVAGDRALRRTAEVLRRSLRAADLVCRYGGEEFLAILPGSTLEDASVIATRIFTAIGEAGRRLELPLTVSIGLASLRHGVDDVESLLHRSDSALYVSKSRGRNRFSIDAS